MLGYDIAPPNPRTHTRLTRQLQQSVGSATPVGAHYDNLPVEDTDVEAVGQRLQSFYRHTHIPQFTLLPTGEAVQLKETNRSVLSPVGLLRCDARHLHYVVLEHVRSNIYDGINAARHRKADRVDAVEPGDGLRRDSFRCHQQKEGKGKRLEGKTIVHSSAMRLFLITSYSHVRDSSVRERHHQGL